MPMEPRGHEATVKFQEDWAMDGAKVYCILTGELMAAEPKNYPITARYTVRYQYSWTECDTDSEGNTYCWTETRIATTSGSITANLLVNGTGVDSSAQ